MTFGFGVFIEPHPHQNSNITMVDTTTSKSLQEPLLSTSERNEVVKDETDCELLNHIKIISFAIGAAVTIFSQYVLWLTYWNEAILEMGSWTMVKFGFVWSCWTCLFIFGAMACSISILNKVYKLSDRFTGSLDWDDVMFLMEAHHVVGALISISVGWTVVDALRLCKPEKQIHNMVYLLLTAIWYVICAVFFNQEQRRYEERYDEEEAVARNKNKIDLDKLLPTYKLIASTLGMIIGATSQFALSMVLWNENTTKPIIENNIYIFSSLWSLCTVIMAFIGCSLLNCLTPQDDKEATDAVQTERIFLRMESYYIFSSLCGICTAWILIDMVMDMTSQIVPSLCMLTVSLIAFRAILLCFPEHKCLEEIKQQQREGKAAAKDKELTIQIV